MIFVFHKFSILKCKKHSKIEAPRNKPVQVLENLIFKKREKLYLFLFAPVYKHYTIT